MNKVHTWLALLLLAAVIVISACTPESAPLLTPAPTATPTPTSTPVIRPEATATPTPVVIPVESEGPTETEEPPFSGCPQNDWLYQLDYTHQLVLDQPGLFHLEMNSKPDAAFFFIVREDGTIDSEGYENSVPISFTGTAVDCVIEGENDLYADIFGVCHNGIATVNVFEYFPEGFLFTESCPEGSGLVGAEQLVSAPENRFDFDLNREQETKVVEMDGGIVSIYYSWTLSDYGPMPILPIPLPDE